jgi:hypothetical protein
MEKNEITVNYGLTGVDIRREAMAAIKAIKNKQIDVKEAMAIKGLLDTMVDVGKTQIEYIKSLPKSVKEEMNLREVKAIAGTLIDRDAEMDISMTEIRESQKNPYQ